MLGSDVMHYLLIYQYLDSNNEYVRKDDGMELANCAYIILETEMIVKRHRACFYIS